MYAQLKRRLIAVAATLSMVAVLGVGSGVAQATVIGSLAFTPASGDDTTAMSVDTSGPCLTGAFFQLFVTGAGFPAAGFPVSADLAVAGLTPDAVGGYTVTLTDSMHNLAAAQSPSATLAGTYTFAGRCTESAGGPAVDTYQGKISFTQNIAAPTYTTSITVVAGAFTATTLSASPGGPVNAGTPVTFSAHVSSSPVNQAIGTVQLMDGGSPIGSPTVVDSAGNAAISTSFTGGGDHTITAAFTGKFAFITDSVSPPLVYSVNASVADPTITALAISPSAATAADPITMTASVGDVPHPGHIPTGTVQFADGGVNVGSAVGVDAAGIASLSQAFAQGDHSFTASFVPTDPAQFDPSSSTSEAYTVAPAATATEPIVTTVDPGSLTISVADTQPVTLPSPVLNPDATFLASSGAMHPVTVTDTRAGNPGWQLSGQVSDFSSSGGAIIPGVDLGWLPLLVDKSQGQVIVLGPEILPAQPPLVADPAHAGTVGLQASRTLASAAAGSGTGTTHVSAGLTLDVPTTVPAGTYEAVLTLTAI